MGTNTILIIVALDDTCRWVDTKTHTTTAPYYYLTSKHCTNYTTALSCYRSLLVVLCDVTPKKPTKQTKNNKNITRDEGLLL